VFETAELGRTLTKKEYDEREQALRGGLLTVQYDLRDAADFPVIVVLAGNDRAGCVEVMNLLHEWMDPRYLEANVFSRPTDEERERPRYWRYWRSLPPAGRIGIYHREWTSRAMRARMRGVIDDRELDDRLRRIEYFERTLTADGALLLKCWLHLSQDALRDRIAGADGRAEMPWAVTKADRLFAKHYERHQALAEYVVRRTSAGVALWNVVESADARYRNVTVSQLLLQALTKRLAMPRPAPGRRRRAPVLPNPVTVLDQVDLTRSLSKSDYERTLHLYWAKLARLSRKSRRRKLSVVLVVEGWDAAGKGGVIRRVTRAVDAAQYRVIPVAAPTEEERAHHYLWRFWRRLPGAGHWVLFDRSWYGRVLVERLEGFATEREWKRAYGEINDFEETLVQHGTLLIKFWIHISAKEQLARFKARERVPFKKYKITPEDYRNRDRWNEYESAAEEMIQRTSPDHAPWNLVAGNDKRWARIEVLRIVCRQLRRALKARGR